MTNSTVDGLGGDEVNQGVTITDTISGTDVFATGSVVAAKIVGSTQVSGAAVYSTGKVVAKTSIGATGSIVSTAGVFSSANVTAGSDVSVGDSILMNYADAEGTVIGNLNAEAIISGGMWVVGSSASGATVAPVAKPAPVNTPQPLGICLANVASGAAASILTQGFYKGPVAEDTLSQGDGFSMGSGTALNCAGPSKAGYARGTVVMGGGSEAVIAVYLW